MKQFLLSLLFFCIGLLCFSQKVISTGYDAKYEFLTNGNTKRIKFRCLIPRNLNGIQKVKSIKYSRSPQRIFEDNGNQYAEFIIDSIDQKVELDISVDIDIIKYDLDAVKDNKLICDTVVTFLNDEKYIEKNDENISRIAIELKKDDEIKTIKNIYNFVNQQITYTGFNPNEVGAAKALQIRSGDCTEFTDIFVALCRANNIPAKSVEGLSIEYIGTPKHSWAEVYTNKYGWIRVDPTPGNAVSFNKLKNKYIQLSLVRNDENLNYKHFYGYRYWGNPIRVNEIINIR